MLSFRLLLSTVLLACIDCVGQAGTDTPRFEDYPATAQLAGPPKRPLLTEPEHRLYKTRLQQAVLRGEGLIGSKSCESPPAPNFAGAFYAVTWGCGSDGCAALAIIDGRTGAVYGPPPKASPTTTGFIATARTHDCPGIGLRAYSRLLFIDQADYSSGQLTCERSYYEWKNRSYRFVKKVSVKP